MWQGLSGNTVDNRVSDSGDHYTDVFGTTQRREENIHGEEEEASMPEEATNAQSLEILQELFDEEDAEENEDSGSENEPDSDDDIALVALGNNYNNNKNNSNENDEDNEEVLDSNGEGDEEDDGNHGGEENINNSDAEATVATVPTGNTPRAANFTLQEIRDNIVAESTYEGYISDMKGYLKWLVENQPAVCTDQLRELMESQDPVNRPVGEGKRAFNKRIKKELKMLYDQHMVVLFFIWNIFPLKASWNT